MTTIEYLKMLKDKVIETDSRGVSVEEYFKDENGVRYGKYVNKRLHSELEISYYKNGKLNGPAKVFSKKDGVLLKEYEYKDGIRNGYIKKYYNNGKLKLDGNIKFIRNRVYLHGEFKRYYSDGTLNEEGTYSMDKFFKKYKKYFPNGNLSKVLNYKRGQKLHGRQFYYRYTDNDKIEYIFVRNYHDEKKVSDTSFLKSFTVVKNSLRNLYKNRDKWVLIQQYARGKEYRYKNIKINVENHGASTLVSYSILSTNKILFKFIHNRFGLF